MGDRSWIERGLALAGTDAPEIAESKLRSMRRLLLLTIACEAWLALRYVPYSSHPGVYGLVATAFVVCLGVGWRGRLARGATATAGLLLFAVVVSVFPDNANHQFLALLLAALIVLVDPRGDEVDLDRAAALQSMRWIAAIGLFWAGVMKLHYGLWLEAEFLGYRIARDPGFAQTLGLLVPGPERARLLALGSEVGAGPFRPEAPWLVAVANLTWLAELALPFGLMWSRTRLLAATAAILLMLAIEAGAREIFFGGLMIGLLLLFARRDRLAPALPVIAVVYGAWLLRPELAKWLGGGAGG